MTDRSPHLSSLSGIAWPAIAGVDRSALRQLASGLEQTQWWTSEALREHQSRQLAMLLDHAFRTVPYYREQGRGNAFDPRDPVTPASLATLPLLYRQDVQDAGDALRASPVPGRHGPIHEGKTSGSTGRPLHYYGTGLTRLFWQALTLRDHAWHRRDLGATLGVIRVHARNHVRRGWGPATDAVNGTGLCGVLDINTDIDAQVRWLQGLKPAYLLTYPSNLRAVAQWCLDQRIRLVNLREVRTLGEVVDASLRELCQEALGVPLVDTYSAEEVGYIGLQCPESGHYHIQSETLLVELLNERGNPCATGETGQVVITTLHNFAMPLIRYAILDYAVAGPPCPCGRGLPTIERIFGRQRDLVTLPDGRRRWPLLGYHRWSDLAPIRQVQFVQRELDAIEVRIVAASALTVEQERNVIAAMQKALGHPFRLKLHYVDRIPRSEGGKYADFLSELDERITRPTMDRDLQR